MITFNVVKEEFGWAVRMADHMTTPFGSKDLAILEANSLAKGIRCHGQCAEVTVECTAASDQRPVVELHAPQWTDAFSRRRRTATQ